jgi:hypothetical protein
MTRLLAGAALCLVAFAAWLVATHYRERPWFDRPGFARWRGFDALASLLRWAVFAAGLLALSAHSAAAAALAIAVFLMGWGWRLVVRSAALKRRAMRRALAGLRRQHPGEPETELLVRLVLSTHPRWGEELVRQMVIDSPDVDEMARVVARMEQGFRGFR